MSFGQAFVGIALFVWVMLTLDRLLTGIARTIERFFWRKRGL